MVRRVSKFFKSLAHKLLNSGILNFSRGEGLLTGFWVGARLLHKYALSMSKVTLNKNVVSSGSGCDKQGHT
jgi:hypothetical protein